MTTTLKTNENWRKLTCDAIIAKKLQGRAIEIEGQDVLDLCHDADMAAGLEKKNAALQAKLDEAWAWLGEVFPKIQTSSQWIDYHTITGEQASRLIALRTPKEQEK